MAAPEPIYSEHLGGAGCAIAHGFFTRCGGQSTGIYRGLNVGLGSRDNRDSVLANRQAAIGALGIANGILLTPHQIHSNDVVVGDTSNIGKAAPQADAIVTRNPELTIGVLTADCGPVLFADQEAGVIGAAHAGWKGALGGILENTIEAMEKLGAKHERITAVLGPTIAGNQYEVGPEFVDRFVRAAESNQVYFRPSENAGHAMFDLPGYILARLQGAGVSANWTGNCTYCEENRFFSYRRATHRGESDYGRQLSAIVIRT